MIFYYLRGVELHMRYPRWRASAAAPNGPDGAPLVPMDRQVDTWDAHPLTFDRVFLCRSGAWVPSWVDEEFFEFVAACPVPDKRPLGTIEPRVFDEALVEVNYRRFNRLAEEEVS